MYQSYNNVPGANNQYSFIPQNPMFPFQNGMTTYIVQKGDTLYGIASKNNTDTKTLAAINGIEETDYIYPNQKILIPSSNMYITEDGDTLESISNKLRVDPMTIYTLNEKIMVVPDQIIYYKKEKL